MKKKVKKCKKMVFFGDFGSTNFGNESTLLTILYNLRRFQVNGEFVSISTDPEATIAIHHIKSIPIEATFTKSRSSPNIILRMARWICIYGPREFYQCINGFIRLRGTDALIIPGTGLLTDAYGLVGWGPYSLFKWSLIAKICRCKLLFVSVGAGPVYSKLGRYLIKFVLSWADFRSYRDAASKRYLERIGLRVANDWIYPDLVFSIPETFIPHRPVGTGRRVIGIGLMESSGRYGFAGPGLEIQRAYLDNLAVFVTWSLAHDHDIRLLIGDLADVNTAHEFRRLLRDRLPAYEESRIVSEPVSSLEDLLSQIAETDIVIATRFHNVLLSLLCSKPVISISFHHKCESLMKDMGLSKYCFDINNFDVNSLITTLIDIEKNSYDIKLLIKNKINYFRSKLDEQYNIISDLI